jgi:hypothetical protein
MAPAGFFCAASCRVQAGRTIHGPCRLIFARAIAEWENSKPLSGPSLLKMREIDRLRASLSGIVREEFIGTWLDTPNPAFEGLKPVEVIERGEIDRIWRMIYEVGSGQPTEHRS